jgi:hypothetical protein
MTRILRAAIYALLAMAPALHAQTGNIDPAERHAWAENAGWLDFRPAYGGVTVLPTHVTGYAWQESVGWVKLGSDAGGPYANTTAANWGVNLNAVTGALSGFAWAENAGWIRFDPAYGGVTYDGLTRQISGWAWSESLGWLHFRSTTPTAYGVAVACGTLTGAVTGGGAVCPGGSSTVTVTVGGGAPPYAVTLDNGGGTQSGAGPAFTFTVSPSSTTNYAVASLTDGLSCAGAGSGSATVTVNSIPAAPAPYSDSPECEGGTVQLGVGVVDGATYSWTGPNGFAFDGALPTLSNVTREMSGDYSVVVTVNGCPSPAGTTTVVVNPGPATPAIAAPASLWPEQPFAASVPAVDGVSYAWDVTNGAVTAGAGTPAISITAGDTGPVVLSLVETNVETGCVSGEARVSIPVALPATRFYPLAPCRLLDTRESTGERAGAPVLSPGETRTYAVGTRCGLGAVAARSLAVNLTVTGPTANGELIVFRGDLPTDPASSSVSYRVGRLRTNSGMLELSRAGDGTFQVLNRSAGEVHFILDVNGYFKPEDGPID